MPRTYERITRTYGKSKYLQEEHMDCIICSNQVGFKLSKPTSPSFASQAPARTFCWAPSIEPFPSSPGVQFHTLSSGYLLKILYIICKAHLGVCLLLFPLSIPCPPESTGREKISSLSLATLQLPLKSIFGLKIF